MKQNTQNGTYITISIHDRYLYNLNRSIQNIQLYTQLYKIEPKEYEKNVINETANKQHTLYMQQTSHLQVSSSPLKMEPTGCPETSVRN